MKIRIEMDKQAKGMIVTIVLALAVILFWYNRRYLYILDAEFSDEAATSIILKTGFLFPVKTTIPMNPAFKSKMRLYGYNISVKKNPDNFEIYLNNKKIQTIYSVSYYEKTHKTPTERVYL
jgi:hypothetical protein